MNRFLLHVEDRRIKVLRSLICILLAITAPPLWSQTPAAQAVPANNTAANADQQPNSEFIRISPGDTLDIRVYQIPEFSGAVRVSGDGRVRLAYLGDVPVAGLTESEAAHRIDEELLTRHLVLNPQTTVYIPAFSARGVTILGEVVHPGVYPLPSSRSLVDIVAVAGGLTPQADTHISIKRSDGFIKESLILLPPDNGKMMLADDISVGIGDRIVVQKAGLIYVLGDVTRPGGYMMQTNGKITVLEAVAAAGGTTHTAGEKKAVLIRRTEDGTAKAPLALYDILHGKKPDFYLSASDVIYVPNSMAKNFIVNAPEILGTLAGAAIYGVVK